MNGEAKWPKTAAQSLAIGALGHSSGTLRAEDQAALGIRRDQRRKSRLRRGFEIGAGDAQGTGEVAELSAGQFPGETIGGLQAFQFAVAAERFDFPDLILLRVPGGGERADEPLIARLRHASAQSLFNQYGG